MSERGFMLSSSLTKQLANRARLGDILESYGADWTVEQLREPAQHITERIDDLMTKKDHSVKNAMPMAFFHSGTIFSASF